MHSKKLKPKSVAKGKAHATIKELLALGTFKLAKKSGTGNLDTEILLAHAIKRDRAFLFAHDDYELTPEELHRFDEALAKRAQGVPVAYIVGTKEFYNLEFIVNKDVLVPRPETELLVETALDIIKNTTEPTVVDTGTGSGAIIVSLAKNVSKKTHFIATDISKPALAVAKKNAKKHGVQGRIKFKQGNILSPLGNSKADILIANLPYVALSDRQAKKKLRHEPTQAIFAKHNGLEIINKYLSQAPTRTKKHAWILLEIGYNQAGAIQKIAHNIFGDSIKNSTILKDFAGYDRVVKIEISR